MSGQFPNVNVFTFYKPIQPLTRNFNLAIAIENFFNLQNFSSFRDGGL